MKSRERYNSSIFIYFLLGMMQRVQNVYQTVTSWNTFDLSLIQIFGITWILKNKIHCGRIVMNMPMNEI